MPLFTPVIDVKRVRGPYCGPTAIAALTGVPISRIEKMLRRRRRGGYKDINGRKIPIQGTGNHEVLRVLKTLGCKVKKFTMTESTISRFCHDTEHAGTFLVNVTDHYVTTHAGLVCDTYCKTPTPVAEYPKPQLRVVRAWRVEAPESPKYTIADPIKPQRAAKPPRDLKAERHTKALAVQKKWQRKLKLAQTKLKAANAKVRYYERVRDGSPE
jgi:hypothetical protein